MNFNRLDMFKFSFMTSAFFFINSVGSSLNNMFGVTARLSNSSPRYVEGRLFIKHSNSNNVSFNSENVIMAFPHADFLPWNNRLKSLPRRGALDKLNCYLME